MSLIPLVLLFSSGYESWIGEEVRFPWFAPLSIEFHLSVDSLSLLFVALTAVIIPVTLLALPSGGIAFSRNFLRVCPFAAGAFDRFFYRPRLGSFHHLLGSDAFPPLFYHLHLGRAFKKGSGP